MAGTRLEYINSGFYDEGDGVWIPCLPADIDIFDQFRVTCMVLGESEREWLVKWMARYNEGYEHLIAKRRLMVSTKLVEELQKHFRTRLKINLKNLRYYRDKVFVEGEHYWQSQLKKYKTYVYDLRSITKLFEKMLADGQIDSMGRNSGRGGKQRTKEFGASNHKEKPIDMSVKHRWRAKDESGIKALKKFDPPNT